MVLKSQKQELLQMLSSGEISRADYKAALNHLPIEKVKPWTIGKAAKIKMSALMLLIAAMAFGPPDMVYNVIKAVTPDSSSSKSNYGYISAKSSKTISQSGMAYTNQATLACLTPGDMGKFSIIYKQQGEAAARAYGKYILIPTGASVYLVQGGFSAGLGGYQELEYKTAAGRLTLFTASGAGRFRKM